MERKLHGGNGHSDRVPIHRGISDGPNAGLGQETLEITEEAQAFILSETDESAKLGVETGGYLVGSKARAGKLILHAIGPGPNAHRSAGKFEADYQYTATEFKRLNADNSKYLCGAWHVHCLEGPSGGDIQTLHRVGSEHKDFIALIVCGYERKHIRAFVLKDGKVIERPVKGVAGGEAVDYSRTSGLVNHRILARKKILIVGNGSGGCLTASYLGYSGVGRYTLADSETLERVNLVRHIGKFHQLGMHKADICANELREINPEIRIIAVKKNIGENNCEEFEPYIKSSHLVLGCTGGSLAYQLLNELCLKHRKPAIYAGVFERARGGYVLQSIPYLKNAPCFNCIFDHSKHAHQDSNEFLKSKSRDYGIPVEELAAQQGLFIDISFVALLQAKLALMTLLRGTRHSLSKPPANFVVWNSESMTAHWVKLRKRPDCAVCNEQEFLNSGLADESGEKKR